MEEKELWISYEQNYWCLNDVSVVYALLLHVCIAVYCMYVCNE